MEQENVIRGEDFNINEGDISNEMVRQPGLYVYYANLYSNKMKESANLKTQLDSLQGKIHQELKAEELAGTKLTDKDKEKRLKSDSRYLMARQKLDTAEIEEEYYRNLLDALKQKKDMLIQLALRQRDEMKGPVAITSNVNMPNDYFNIKPVG